MQTQRKRIASGRQDNPVTEIAINVVQMILDTEGSVNLHGLNVTMGVSPRGPDETLVGRWYVAVVPKSVAEDSTIRNAWIAQMNTITSANAVLDSSEFIWGAGSFVCAEQSTFHLQFSPQTSRNVKEGSRIFVLAVADAVSGAVDDWDAAATISVFTS